jgi:glycosyltransferase involved in cell wall biosynthesis
MTPPKLLHIRSSYFYGGPERQITYLTQCLADLGIESAVATFAPKDDPGRNRYYGKLEQIGMPAHRIDISGSFDRAPISTLEAIITKNNYTLLVGHDYRADYFVVTLAKKLGLPAFSFSRGWTQNTFKVRFYEWLDVRFLKRMSGVVAVSRAKYEELLRRGIAERRLIHIPNSILLRDSEGRRNVVRDRWHIPHDAFLIGSAGRLSIEKNQEILIQAAINVVQQQRSSDQALYCLLAGEGPRRAELEAMIPPELKSRIILPGWIDDIDAFYSDIDAFALTSLMEGFPNVLLEAGVHSLPVISTPAGGAVDIIEDGVTGRLIPFASAAALADAMLTFLRDHEYCVRLGHALNAVTRDRYDARRNAARFVEFVDHIRGQA